MLKKNSVGSLFMEMYSDHQEKVNQLHGMDESLNSMLGIKYLVNFVEQSFNGLIKSHSDLTLYNHVSKI